jgi:hypothetical protein
MAPRSASSMICGLGIWSLRKHFQFFLALLVQKNAYVAVAAHLEISGGSNQWNISFARPAHTGRSLCLVLQCVVFSSSEA